MLPITAWKATMRMTAMKHRFEAEICNLGISELVNREVEAAKIMHLRCSESPLRHAFSSGLDLPTVVCSYRATAACETL